METKEGLLGLLKHGFTVGDPLDVGINILGISPNIEGTSYAVVSVNRECLSILDTKVFNSSDQINEGIEYIREYKKGKDWNFISHLAIGGPLFGSSGLEKDPNSKFIADFGVKLWNGLPDESFTCVDKIDKKSIFDPFMPQEKDLEEILKQNASSLIPNIRIAKAVCYGIYHFIKGGFIGPQLSDMATVQDNDPSLKLCYNWAVHRYLIENHGRFDEEVEE